MTTHESALISADALSEILGRDNVKVLDCSYGMADIPVRIGHAADFDIDLIADLSAPLPHTLPSPEEFAKGVGDLGISNDDMVVVYDRAGMHMAASRVWWMFRVFGHDNVRILDGGLPAWVAQDFKVEPKDEAPRRAAVFRATYRPELFREKIDIIKNLTDGGMTIIDARDPKRYSGEAPEPRPGIGSGHIPGSQNLFFGDLIDHETGLLKKRADIQQTIADSGIDTSKPVAISCGSGVTACVVALGLFEAGYKNAAVYGGSWTEWGADSTLPKRKGSAP